MSSTQWQLSCPSSVHFPHNTPHTSHTHTHRAPNTPYITLTYIHIHTGYPSLYNNYQSQRTTHTIMLTVQHILSVTTYNTYHRAHTHYTDLRTYHKLKADAGTILQVKQGRPPRPYRKTPITLCDGHRLYNRIQHTRAQSLCILRHATTWSKLVYITCIPYLGKQWLSTLTC